jgi:hypothetical protein
MNGPSLELLVDWLYDAVIDGDRARALSIADELASAARRFAVEPVLSETP